jgi:hypothetical protein
MGEPRVGCITNRWNDADCVGEISWNCQFGTIGNLSLYSDTMCPDHLCFCAQGCATIVVHRRLCSLNFAFTFLSVWRKSDLPIFSPYVIECLRPRHGKDQHMSYVIKVGNQTARENQCDHGNKDDVGVKDLVPSPAQGVSGGVRVCCLTRCGEP